MDSFSKTVGTVLRRARRRVRLTLHDVAALSLDTFGPTTVGGYERGERGITLARFCELAAIYGVPADRLLAEVLEESAPDGRGSVMIDLTRLHLLRDSAAGLVASFVHDIRTQRGDYQAPVITLRSGDLQTLALAARVDPPSMLATLRPVLGPQESL